MAIFKTKTIVTNEINKTGELVMKEDRKEIKYLFGIPIIEWEYKRDTEQSKLNVDDSSSIGFMSK